jgi:hypothetical protein
MEPRALVTEVEDIIPVDLRGDRNLPK